ncbi:hypothetical protein [Nocardiopsis lambiniae]|uniref:Uncharacterized protein n=1 Tax=Nocardiopsis lambiniae TaxID=3075539 RepID=A0ABU2MG04_9ACTN|nr:hypothetical protein [Nocardiopsis sp. DSM 44743]MDT0331621.1 hypothetical protein [Nocardiopsis sp. DSM 44743]
MNELDHLRTLRSEISERSPEELALLTGWRPGGEGLRSVRRPRMLPLVLSGVALVAAATVFLALVVFPGSLTVGVGPATDPSEEATEGTVGADPLDTMGPLIEKIGAQEQTGTVWYTSVERTESMGVGPEDDPYAILYRSPAEYWRDTTSWQSVGRPLGNSWELASEGQRAAWERDGSPQRWTETLYGEEMEIPREFPLELGEPYEDRYTPVGDRFLAEGSDVFDLPADPDGLRHEFGLGTTVRPGNEPLLPYHDAAVLPASPEVRAGIYAMIAQAPEAVPFEGEDVLGRPAVGISQTAGEGTSGRFEYRLLFDPETAMPLSYETIVIEPSTSHAAWRRPGEHTRYVVYEEMGWTDDWPL